jgi:hypothetical protein
MSSASMQGSTRYVSSLKEGGLLFSDGSTQTTAYTATTNSDGTTDLSLANLTVTDSATIETCYVGSNSSTSGLVIYGNCSQILSDTTTTQYGQNTLNGVTTGVSNTAFGSVCLNNLNSGSSNCGMGYTTLQNCTTGSYNTGIGTGNMPTLSTSGNNTALGASSGGSISTATGYNTCLGYGADSSYSYSTAIGYNASTSTSNQIVLGTSSENVFIPGNITINSPPILSYSTLITPTSNQIGYIKGGSLTTNTTIANTDTQLMSLSLSAGVWSILGSAVFPASDNNSSFIGLSISPFTNASDPNLQISGFVSNTNTGFQISRYVFNNSENSYYLIATTSDNFTCSYINMSALRIA